LGKQIKALAGVRKPFICTDKGITKAEITQKIVDLIKADTGLDPVVFDETAANPTDNNVHDGLKVYQDYGCDMIISLGGGSSHDCAKGIGILATNGGDIRDYEGTDKSKKNMPPFIAVNTTAGTASEMTRFCIITDTSRKVKMPIIDQRVTPNVAINDPLLMMSMPPSLTAATGMDALTHAIEAYVSTMATPITDSCALKAISLITNSLRAAVANGRDPVARENMAYAEYLAGMAFNSASLGHVHAMAHQLGGFYDLPHGVSNAILLPHVEQYNLMAKMDRFVDIAVAMGEKVAGMSQRTAAERAIEAMKVLASDIGIPGRLRDLGVREKDLPLMAKNAQKDACSFTNPRCPSLEDIVNIYKSAL
jgi:alcohol dehydrogenase